MTSGGNENARGLNPELWGPPVWRAFHYTAAGFPSQPSQSDRENYRQYFSKFPFVLPCEECKHHAVALLARMPPVVDSRDRMFEWTVNFHNAVNARIGGGELTLNQARTHYGLPEVAATAAPRAAPPTPGAATTVASGGAPLGLERPLGGATHARSLAAAPAVVRAAPTQANRVMGYNASGLSQSSTRTMYRAPQQHHIRAPPQVRTRAPPTQTATSNTRQPAKRRCNCGGR